MEGAECENDDFRRSFCYILPKRFDLNTCMDVLSDERGVSCGQRRMSLRESRSNSLGSKKTMVSLHSIIGYNGGHYINFSKKGKIWYKFDDSSYYEIGSYEDLLIKMAACKILPYLVLYKVDERRRSGELSSLRNSVLKVKNSNISSKEISEKRVTSKNNIISPSQIPSTEQINENQRMRTIYTVNIQEEDSIETSGEKSLKRFNTGGDSLDRYSKFNSSTNSKSKRLDLSTQRSSIITSNSRIPKNKLSKEKRSPPSEMEEKKIKCCH
mmetsp:Transcript_5031/g.4266  ORF Transcript_5031/g.4266 Transcript_5031/m.4266 type:complete len:269 (-) Transcript_5031:70-876(-)